MGDGLRKELSTSFLDVLASRVPDFMQRRRIERQMDQIAESSAEKLARLVETEFRDLDEGEQQAAADAASDALINGLGAVEISTLDYDPVRLKEHLQEQHAGRVGRFGLSDSGTRLYHLILSESSSYIVEVVSTLPNFAANASIEILRRESALIDMVREIYAKLPDPRAAAEKEAAATAEFETNYRRYIARRLDRLELFGLSVSEFSSRYALSVAYITLSVKRRIGAGYATLDEKLAGGPKAEGVDDAFHVRVDDAIGSTRRVFVRGAAGSGKTTLLQWIAVSAARNEFEGAMAEWNGTVPFFLQLRRFSKGELPGPDDFLTYAGPGMLERAPAGWASEQLLSGRAVLLIDGVDEVAESDRSRIRRWLDDLIDTYPDCRYVVTSRPAAVADDWLLGEGFSSVDLQPMTMSDIQEFIAHWHQAAARNTAEPEQLVQLNRYQTTLTETISASRQIRSLATTPLLCAMLCALNRDRRTQLPKDRVELYRIALEMLLERRDLEREVGTSGPSISLPEKLILLRELAYWLVLNEQSDAEYQVAVERFAYRLRFMPNLRLSGERVLKYLLVRSGLLREPVQGRIDFIHRTFQEYLAALEVSELGNIPMLVSRATEDNWREVVILAAGTCHSRQKSELFEGLLRRGREEAANQHTLYLLAVACLETAREVPPELAADISNCLNELLPPKNITEAKELASAGDLALSRLGEYRLAKAQEAAACVRAACLIGGESSLQVLANYTTDPRKTVQRELLRGWALHDQPQEYSETVLAEAPLVEGAATISDPSLIPFVRNLTKLRELEVLMRGVPAHLNMLRDIPQLAYFDARGNSRIDDLTFLSESRNLYHLDLERCSNLDDLAPLGGLANLLLLDVSSSKVRDISAISRMAKLNWLSLSYCHNIDDWEPLRACTRLATVYLSGCKTLPSLDIASDWRNLSRITVNGTSIISLDPVGRNPHAKRISASGCPNLSDVSSVDGNPSLNYLQLFSNVGITSIESLVDLPALTYLTLEGCVSLQRLPDAPNWPRIQTLFLGGCRRLTDFSLLESVQSTRTLSLSRTQISDLGPLSKLKRLGTLFLDDCKQVRDLSPLRGLSNLTNLRLTNVPYVDLAQLGENLADGLTVTVSKGQAVDHVDSFRRSGGRLRVVEPYRPAAIARRA
ncbi:NACHT domain-containing protein [Micromonospora aurantiaca]